MPKQEQDLSVHIELFDAQHSELSKLLKEFQLEINRKASFFELKAMFEHLFDKTKCHFDTEEKLMLDYGFDGYADHKHDHDVFLQVVADSLADYIKNPESFEFESVLKLVNTWIVKHIIYRDRLYMDFFASKGVS